MLRDEARCGPDADLAVVEQRSTELRACRKELDRVERDLVRSGDGASIVELEAEAAGVDRDTMDARAGEISALLVEMEESLTAAHEVQATTRADLSQFDGPSAASEKAEEIQATLAKLREDVVRYARLRVASDAPREEDRRLPSPQSGTLTAACRRALPGDDPSPFRAARS